MDASVLFSVAISIRNINGMTEEQIREEAVKRFKEEAQYVSEDEITDVLIHEE